ncbi:MAG: helix-turn-helix transcriptional regulator [Verrucomicrobiales bacterium]
MAGEQNVIGEQVRKRRVALDWSQETLATNCQLQGWDVSRGTLSKIEARLRRVTDAELFVLALVLKVELNDLFRSPMTVKKALRNPQGSNPRAFESA